MNKDCLFSLFRHLKKKSVSEDLSPRTKTDFSKLHSAPLICNSLYISHLNPDYFL